MEEEVVVIQIHSINDYGSNSSIMLPSSESINVGNLIIIHTTSYYSPLTVTSSGWNQVSVTAVGYGDNEVHSCLYWKVATSTDPFSTVNLSGGFEGFTITSVIVVSGVNMSTPVYADRHGGTEYDAYSYTLSDYLSRGNITGAPSGKRIHFTSAITRNSANAQITYPAGYTEGPNTVNTSGYGYLSAKCAISNSTESGTISALTYGATVNIDWEGAINQRMLYLVDGNIPPTASQTAPANNAFTPNETTPVTFSWNYSDTEGNSQNAYEIRYRVKNSMLPWNNVANASTSNSHTFAPGTFTKDAEYEWQVRVSDALAGYGAYSSVRYFTAGTEWTLGSEVTSAISSGTIPYSGLPTSGEYEYQIRTADSQGFGNWSSTSTFVVKPQSNVYHKSAGSFSLAVKKIKVDGIWITVGSTKIKSGGSFS